MHSPFSVRRTAVALAGVTALLVGAAAAGAATMAAGDEGRNGPSAPSSGPDGAAVLLDTGSELQFVAVAPCRIIDTRKAGGAIKAGSRTFDATLASYATQGGLAGSCNIPAYAVSIQLNLGAISQDDKTSDIKGWATGTSEPTASLVNYNPSGPVANMVTMPVNAGGQFTLKTPGSAQVFADVAGYYQRPLNASIAQGGGVYQGNSSGLVSATRTSTGVYTLVWEREVVNCTAAVADTIFSDVREVSPDVTTNPSGDTSMQVVVRDAAGTLVDTYFEIRLTC